MPPWVAKKTEQGTGTGEQGRGSFAFSFGNSRHKRLTLSWEISTGKGHFGRHYIFQTRKYEINNGKNIFGKEMSFSEGRRWSGDCLLICNRFPGLLQRKGVERLITEETAMQGKEQRTRLVPKGKFSHEWTSTTRSWELTRGYIGKNWSGQNVFMVRTEWVVSI